MSLAELRAAECASEHFPVGFEYDGPPRASFELMGRRGVYQTFMLIGPEDGREEMLGVLRAALADMSARGGRYLFWRRRPEFERGDGDEYPLSLRARFAVLDERGEQVMMKIGYKEEGAPAALRA